MTPFSKLYHFLGSVRFAIVLIVTVVGFVIAGTLIESLTDSHFHAANFTYHNPLFEALLCGFFINILFAATRRWPFKVRHIAFLLTHLGLLCLIAGTFVKSLYGTQGSLNILEGSASQELFLPNTFVIHVEGRSPSSPSKTLKKNFPLHPRFFGGWSPHVVDNDPLKIELLGYAPHSKERLEGWIKGSHAFIDGLPPFVVQEIPDTDTATEILPSAHAQMIPDAVESWNLYALRGADVCTLARKVYLQGTSLCLSRTENNQPLLEIPLAKALEGPIPFPQGTASFSLHFDYSPVTDFEEAALHATLLLNNGQEEHLIVPLNGPETESSSFLVDLKRTPSLALIQDLQGDDFLFVFGKEGKIHAHAYRADNLHSLLAFDKGFRGYAVRALVPLRSENRSAREQIVQQQREKAYLLSAFLQSQGLNPSLLNTLPSVQVPEILPSELTTPLTLKQSPLPPLKKWEDNLPMVTLRISSGGKQQVISLTYDRYATGLKWPVLDGKYLLRFQPDFQHIPYRVRLRDARQISYPNSNQPYSYESDLIVTGKGIFAEKTISMNNVFETGDGYRFYMANISPPTEGVVQRAQIAVNHDPAKYILTYPGALILAIGIIGLFWFKIKRS